MRRVPTTGLGATFLVGIELDHGPVGISNEDGRHPFDREGARDLDSGGLERFARLRERHGDAFEGLSDSQRKRRMAMVLTLTGARTWYALRRDYGLSPEDTLRNVTEQLTALLDMSGPNAT